MTERDLSNSKISFHKKPKSTIKERKTAKMTYIWFSVHSLAGHAPKSPKYKIIKFGRLTARNLSEVAKIILKWRFLTQMRVLIKNKEDYQPNKNCEKVLYLILGALIVRTRPKIC